MLIETVVMKKGHSSQGSVVIEIVAEKVVKGIGGIGVEMETNGIVIIVKGMGHM